MSTTARARARTQRATEHPLVEKGARLGFAANGVVNIVIGWIALQLAGMNIGGGGDDEASASGALDTIATTPVGVAALVIAVAGLALLALWYIATTFLVEEWSDRLKSLAKGITYGVLAGLTVTVLAGTGSGEGESEQASSVTAPLMEHAAGRILVAAVGLAVAGVGIYQIVKGLTKKFCHDLDRHPPRWAVHTGRIGYTTRGITFVMVGAFFVIAAVTADPDEARGLDGALQAMLELPFGSVVLGAAALGLVAYGIYCFARARFARI